MTNRNGKAKNKLNVLRKGENSSPKPNNSLNFSIRKLNQICKSLSVKSNVYKPECTIRLITDYLSEKNKIERILYSEISNYIFSLDIERRGIFATNIDNLLQYTMNYGNVKNAEISDDCKKIVIKIYSIRKLNQICKSLSVKSNVYKPECTIRLITDYLSEKNKIERILYSEISNYIFSLDIERRGIFATNIDNLLQYTMNYGNVKNAEISDDCKKIVIKIYDHFQLALHQIENVKDILRTGTSEVVEGIRKENKGIEREYITILAIFSSIVVAFVGGLNFSNEVLRNMGSISIYRLILVVDFLGFIILNLVYMMIRLIFEMNDMEIKYFNIKSLNYIMLFIAGIVIVLRFFNIHMLPQYLLQFQCWSK